jgi:hypothetical protein
VEPERAARVIQAVLENMQNWQARVEAIAETMPAGSKHEALALARDLHMARCSLIRLTKSPPPEDWDEGA